MYYNRLIFLTTCIIALNFLIIGKFVFALPFLLITIIRVLFLKQKKLFLITLSLIAFFALFFLDFKNQMDKNDTLKNEQDNMFLKLKVWADELYIDGDILKFTASISKRNKILVTTIIKTKEEKKLLQNMNGYLQFTVTGKVKEIQDATNSGQFNANKYYRLQKVVGQISKANVENIKIIHGDILNTIIHKLRKNSILYFEKLPKYLRYYGETLILGYVRPDFYQNNEGVQQLGLLHLFSISGFQVSMFIMIVSFLLKKMSIPTEIIAIILILMLPGYYVFSGSIPSLIRSILLGIITQFFLLFRKNMSIIDLWSMSLLLGFIFQPGILLMLGGQLSYLLSFALIFTRKLNFFKQVLMMNLITLPLLLHVTYQWHILALLANLLLIPFFTYVVVPITVFGVIIYMFFEPLAQSVDFFIYLINNLIKELGVFPGNIIFGKMWWGFVVLAMLITIYLMQNMNSKKGWIYLVLIYSVAVIFIKFPIYGEVTFVDIGQGDSIFIQTPLKREVTLIDTGGRLKFKKEFKWQEQTKKSKTNAELFLLPYLLSRGVNKIDQIILTHADADHSGDLEEVLKTIKTEVVYVGNGLEKDKRYTRLQKKYQVKILPLTLGDKIKNSNLNVLWPINDSLGRNEDSIVTYAKYGNNRFLFMGDLDKQNEMNILNMQKNLIADVIKLGHHGSKTSSGDDFLKRIRPKIAIISAGRNNRYKHPHDETMRTLAKNKIAYFNTQTDGMIKYKWSIFNTYWSKVKSE